MALAKQAPALAKPALRSHTRDRGRGRRLFPAQAFEEGEDGRLFSNLDTSLTRRPGNIVGATSLVAGTTVGAGILALPNEAQYSGFGPFTVGTIACWLYSVVTGLLIAEVSLNTVCELGGGSCSMTSMANRTLGRSGSYISSAAYVFLHYAILVAYSAKGGEVLSESLGVDSRWGPVLLNTTLGALVYFTSPSQLDFANTVLVSGVVVSFIGLLGIALTSDGGIDVNNLGKVDWSHVVPSFPVMALAFVYQNVVPNICTSLEGDPKKIRTSILLGTGIPCFMFLLWNMAVLGRVNVEEQGSGVDPLAMLTASDVPFLGSLVNGFQVLAIATSFIGFTLGLTDFIGDYFKLRSTKSEPGPFLATLVPPTLLASLYPEIFVNAVRVAGTFGVMTLFGALPPTMAWAERHGDDDGPPLPLEIVQLVPGGKLVLGSTGSFAGLVIAQDIFQRLGLA